MDTVELFGGPNDGAKLLMPIQGKKVEIESWSAFGVKTVAIYVWEVTEVGRFRLRYIGSLG